MPTELWNSYLQWYRKVLDLPVRNHTRLTGLRPGNDGLIAAEVEQGGGQATLWTRTVVLATGIEGNGKRHIPRMIADNLPKDRWAHTHEEIDFANLAGRTVAVLGGAASAFDNGIVAAEQGARAVHLFHREAEVHAANAMAWGEFNGYLAHFPDLAPADRWRFTQQMKRFKTGPPIATVERAASLPNMFIHRGTNWSAVRMEADAIRIDATDGVLMAEFAILGTGYVTNIAVVDELTGLLPLILLWGDVFTPPPGEEDPELSGSCYLGANFELQEKMPGTAPWLNAVFNFARGAQLSMGAMPIGLSGIKFGIPRLLQGITRRLFIEDVPEYFEGMKVWQGSAAVYEP
jgi:cation diffusion facilitator CzcD-associated flavoprotein CzcO